MTREEAIKRFETLLLHVDTDCVMGMETTEAINMAIKALKQPELCEDAVSRETILKFLDDWKSVLEDNVHNQSVSDLKIIKKDFENLPSAQPEPHWIPVTQDTPTEDDDYWCTFDAETGRFVDWASWYHGRWVTWIEGSPAPLSNVIAWQKSPEPYKGVTT